MDPHNWKKALAKLLRKEINQKNDFEIIFKRVQMHLQSKQISEFFLQGLITDCEYSFDRWGKVKKMLSNGGKATGIHIEHFSNALTGDLPPSVLKIQSIAFWRTVKTSEQSGNG